MSARRHVPLLVLLTVAAALRFTGIGFGLPHQLRPDEDFFRASVLYTAATGDTNPHHFAYGGLGFHLLFAWVGVAYGAERAVGATHASTLLEFAQDGGHLTRLQRVLSALLGVATVWFAVRIGRRLHSAETGLVAGSFVATAFLLVRDSHFGTVDTLAACATTAALEAVVVLAQRPTVRAAIIAGLGCGIAAAVRYAPAVLAVPITFAIVAAARERGRSWLQALTDRRLFAAALASAVAFVVVSPWTFLAWSQFRRGLTHETIAAQAVDASITGTAWHMLMSAFPDTVGCPLAVLAAVALVVSLVTGARADRMVAIFALVWCCAFLGGSHFYLRWLGPMIPAASVLAAVLMSRLADRRRLAGGARLAAVGGMAAILVATALPRLVAFDALLLRDSTLAQTSRWLGTGLPRDAVVSCPFPGITPMISGVVWTDWDPRALLARPEWYAVIPRHPLDRVTSDPGWASVTLTASGDAVEVFRATGLTAAGWEHAEFEQTDLFFYPLHGAGEVIAPGPDISVVRVRPKPAAVANMAAPEPPIATPEVRDGQLIVSVRPAPGQQPLGHYLRYASDADVVAGHINGPIAVPAAHPVFVSSSVMMHGWYHLQVATVVTDGVGPWSEPVSMELP